MPAQRVNLGCGNRYHADWINIDVAAHGPNVIAHDLSQGIPLGDNSCDVAYHSAVLEHLRRSDGEAFMRECFRVLKPGGILRVGVPDLEQICRLYLEKLERASHGDTQAEHDYNWMLLELFDQTVREKTGGMMLDYLRQSPIPNEKFVLDRIGEEGHFLIDCLRQEATQTSKTRSPRQIIRGILSRFRKSLLKLLMGSDAPQALEVGLYRLAGEVHQWMYDRYSLARLLEHVGFQDPIRQSATQSQIDNWSSFYLDTDQQGNIIKPDSLFMEAVKPHVR